MGRIPRVSLTSDLASMRLSIPCLDYHQELTPDIQDTWCFSAGGVSHLELVDALLDALKPGYEVGLPHPEEGCSHRMRRTPAGYQVRRFCHGHFADPWRDATRAEATEWLLSCAKSMIERDAAEGYLHWIPADAAG